MYPKGTIDLENAKHNIYDVSIANRIKVVSKGDEEREDKMFRSAFAVLLLPLWFAKE